MAGDETKPQARVANPQVVSQQSAAKLTIATKIEAPNRAGLCGQTIPFEAVLTDAAGNTLAGKALVFDAHGLFHDTKQTDAQGRAKRPYTVGEKQKADGYPFTVSFAGDNTHLASTASATFLLSQATTKIVIADVALVYNEGKNPGPGVAVVAVHLERDYDGKKIPGNVKVKVNGALVNTVSSRSRTSRRPATGPGTSSAPSTGTTATSRRPRRGRCIGRRTPSLVPQRREVPPHPQTLMEVVMRISSPLLAAAALAVAAPRSSRSRLRRSRSRARPRTPFSTTRSWRESRVRRDRRHLALE